MTSELTDFNKLRGFCYITSKEVKNVLLRKPKLGII